jgi:hypothetical protein
MGMKGRALSGILYIAAVLSALVVQLCAVPTALAAAGATTSVHLVKYDTDGVTVLAEKTVDYKWMEQNLKVYGDGKTHYYHQGPIFEGDLWDPSEVNNLKDKGAVEGTAVRDLVDQIGGMAPGDEVMLVAVDKWHTEFAYENIYEPLDIQGQIALCWFNGEDALEGERYGTGYPANNAYRTALQIVFMANTTNSEGEYVFGNSDMKVALPQEKYQHFFEGQYPSTNGLSGKWITEIRVYSGGVPAGLKLELKDSSSSTESEDSVPWIPIAFGLVGGALIVVIGSSLYIWKRQR